MIGKEDKQRMRALLTEAVTMLCKNGIQYKSGFSIEGLIGITVLDDEQTFLININEIIKGDSPDGTSDSEKSHKSKKRRKKRRRNTSSSESSSESSAEDSYSVEPSQKHARAKLESTESPMPSPIGRTSSTDSRGHFQETNPRFSNNSSSTPNFQQHSSRNLPFSVPPSQDFNTPVHIKQEAFESEHSLNSPLDTTNPLMGGAAPMMMGGVSSAGTFPAGWDQLVSSDQQKRLAQPRMCVRWTLGQKQQICLFKRLHPSASQQQIANFLGGKWGMSISQPTVWNILNKASYWLSQPLDSGVHTVLGISAAEAKALVEKESAKSDSNQFLNMSSPLIRPPQVPPVVHPRLPISNRTALNLPHWMTQFPANLFGIPTGLQGMATTANLSSNVEKQTNTNVASPSTVKTPSPETASPGKYSVTEDIPAMKPNITESSVNDFAPDKESIGQTLDMSNRPNGSLANNHCESVIEKKEEPDMTADIDLPNIDTSENPIEKLLEHFDVESVKQMKNIEDSNNSP